MRQPRDDNHNAVPLVPPSPALAVTVNTSLASAVDVTLNANTTLLEVNALSQGLYMRYASTAGATAGTFDEFIQAGSVRHYVVPRGVTVVSFLQQAASASLVLIEKA